MIQRYGIIDVGSNTIVLLIYEVSADGITKSGYQVTAAHLVQYVHNGHMDTAGIDTAEKIVRQYREWCDLHGVHEVHVDITACGRNIDNQDILLDRIRRTGVKDAVVLSGEEEAACDFCGTSLDRTIESGLMIDIGGGSTEFVRFEKGKILDAVSIPLGCVRLADQPYTPDISLAAIAKMRQEHPLLSDCEDALGVGGTIRACQSICNHLYHAEHSFSAAMLEQMYKGLVEDEPDYLSAMRLSVSPARQDVFIPGMGMLTAAERSFHLKYFHNSENGVREGFLLRHVLHTC